MADATTLSVLLTARDEVSAKLEKVGTNMGRLGSTFEKHSKAIGVSLIAVGAGLQVLAKNQQELTESTRQLAFQTGFTEKEIRSMVKELSNATFPLQSVIDLMTTGAKAGLESGEALKQYATFWDMIGDATKGSAEKMALSATALKSLGIGAGQEGELLKAFGLIAMETTTSVQQFLMTISRVAPELAAMGLSVDDVAVLLAAMEAKGITGRIAQQEFREALEKSETGLAGVIDHLGITSSELEEFRQKLGESGLVMEEQSKIYADSMTQMDHLTSAMKDLTFEHGGLIQQASTLAPIFLVLGSGTVGYAAAVNGLRKAKLLLIPVLVRAKAAFIALNISMGTIALVILGIAAAVAGIILLWKNWDKVMRFLTITAAKLEIEIQKLWLGFQKVMLGWGKLTKASQENIKTMEAGIRKTEHVIASNQELIRVTEEAAATVETAADKTADSNELMAVSTEDMAARSMEAATMNAQHEVNLANEAEIRREADLQSFRASLTAKIKASADLRASREADMAAIIQSFSKEEKAWREMGINHEITMRSFALATKKNLEDTGQLLVDWGGDLTDAVAVSGFFERETGKNFFAVAQSIKNNMELATEAVTANSAAQVSAVVSGNATMLESTRKTSEEIDKLFPDAAAIRKKHRELFGDPAPIENKEAEVVAGLSSLNRVSVQRAQDLLDEHLSRGSRARTPAEISRVAGLLSTQKSGDTRKALELMSEKGTEVPYMGGIPSRRIGQAALGGFAGGLTMVGERGPELVSLPGGSYVHRSGTGPGGQTNNFVFNGAVYGVEDLKEVVVEAVRDHAISGGFSGVFQEA